MAVLNFEKRQDLVIFDNGDNPFIAGFTPEVTGELQYIVLFLYTVGTPTGTVKVNLLSSIDQATPIASSDIVSLSDFTSSLSDKITWVRFDFNRTPVSVSSSYILQLESNGYIRNGDTNYLAYMQQQVGTPNQNLNSVVWGRYSKPAEFLIYLRS